MLLESKVKITSSRERNAVRLQKPKKNLKAVGSSIIGDK